MTAKTPVFQIEYLVPGEPVRNTRLALENNAKSIEAALLSGPASPPSAVDLATLAGVVNQRGRTIGRIFVPTAAQGAIPSGGAIETGVLGTPALSPFTLTAAARVSFDATFRVGPNTANVGAALLTVKINGTAYGPQAVARTNDQTKHIAWYADLPAGTHAPAVRCDALGGAVTWGGGDGITGAAYLKLTVGVAE